VRQRQVEVVSSEQEIRALFMGETRMLAQNLEINLEELSEFCRRNHIRWLAVFGSALRDDFGPDSDVDVLVEFDPDHIPGYRFISMQDELSKLLRRDVDLLTRNSLNRWIRNRVLREAQVLYDAA
jgi:predicted nucleotidyltransferase